MNFQRLLPGLGLLGCLLLAACDPTGEHRSIGVHFGAVVGNAPFACGQPFDGVGSDGATIWPLDLRYYVHGLELKDAEGNYQPLALDVDDAHQGPQVVLIDVENGEGHCSGGTPSTHTEVLGRLPAGEYRGLRFVLGVPEALNHANPDLAEEPLLASGLGSGLTWSWLSGYRFLRLDVATADRHTPDYAVHVGSTACEQGESGPRCARGNRAVIELPEFDPQVDRVVLDVAALLRHADLTGGTQGRGCHGANDAPACHAVLPTLGLDTGFDDSGVPLAPAESPQSAFRAIPH
jgi:uncharacterized repeat protein (TIGR04052 family)